MYIMVVEDDESTRRAYSALLRAEGYGVCWASTLEGARKHLRVEEVDLVILAVELQGEMCGLELLPRVPRGVPVFTVSGHDERVVRGMASRYLADPATRFFGKPIDVDLLLQEVRGAHRERREFADRRAAHVGWEPEETHAANR